MPDENHSTITIGTILSHRTKQGMVEFTLNGERTLWDIAKAKEILRMLHEAVEAAVSDTLIFAFLVRNVGLSEKQAAAALLDFRELRQGTKGIVFPF